MLILDQHCYYDDVDMYSFSSFFFNLRKCLRNTQIFVFSDNYFVVQALKG